MTNISKHLLACFIVAATCGTAVSEMRIWQAKDGSRFKAEYIREHLGKYYFDTGRSTVSVAVTNLIPDDVTYIRTMIPPKIDVRVATKTKDEEGEWKDDYVKITTATVDIKKRSDHPFEGVLRGELYLVGKEIATDDYVLVAKNGFPIKFSSDDGKPEFEYSTSVSVRGGYTDYDEETRGRYYKGYLLVVLGPNGDVIDTKTDLRWLTEDKVDKLRQFNVFNFFDENCRKRSVPRAQRHSSWSY